MNERAPLSLGSFLVRFGEDLERGLLRPLEEVLAEYPHLESEIRDAYSLYEDASKSQTERLEGLASSVATAPPPQRIGPYEIGRELGAGGQGQVYLATDLRLGRRVALKVLTGLMMSSSETRRRFAREATVAARLQHPNICAILEAGESDGIPYIAMQYVEGRTLAASIADLAHEKTAPSDFHWDNATAAEERPLSPPPKEPVRGQLREDPRRIESTLRLFEQLARALSYAHQRGVLHRDLKPANIMVQADGTPMLLDFGLARSEDDDLITLTQSGECFGTPAYMAPEQISGQGQKVDHKSDIYALGVSLYEALTFERPFQAKTRAALFHRILTEPAPDLKLRLKSASRDLRVIVATALEKSPDRRYATAQALAEDLRAHLRHEPIEARPLGPLGRIAHFAKREPWITTLAALLLVVLTAATAVAWSQNRALSTANRELARASTKAAEEARTKEEALKREQKIVREYQRASDLLLLERAEAAADELWPLHQNLLPRLDAWRERYTPLLDRAPGHRRALEELRLLAKPYGEEDRARDFAGERHELSVIEANLKVLAEQWEAAEQGDEKASAAIELERQRARAAELQEVTRGRRTYDFGIDLDLQARHDTLARLVNSLDQAVDANKGLFAQIERRREATVLLRELRTDGSPFAKRWAEALAYVDASPHYHSGSLRLIPTLLPLGPDAKSGLLEFLHWPTMARSGDQQNTITAVRRDEDGLVPVDERTGIILVYLPGGPFTMGAQSEDPQQPNFDPEARPDEGPVHTLSLSPFFIGKYEVTQGQWQRAAELFGGAPKTPSTYSRDWFHPEMMRTPIDGRHPVENIDQKMALRVLNRVGLNLPTEAQWEYAARAGRQTIYPAAPDATSLSRYENLSGREILGFVEWGHEALHLDPYVLHAPVGSFGANPFGLFDLGGNVAEWCLDPDARYEIAAYEGDGLRESFSRNRAVRGGSFSARSIDARVSARMRTQAETRAPTLGVRAAITLSP